jgi:hypothetical protein
MNYSSALCRSWKERKMGRDIRRGRREDGTRCLVSCTTASIQTLAHVMPTIRQTGDEEPHSQLFHSVFNVSKQPFFLLSKRTSDFEKLALALSSKDIPTSQDPRTAPARPVVFVIAYMDKMTDAFLPQTAPSPDAR